MAAAAMPIDDETTLPASDSFTDCDPLFNCEQTEVYQIRRRTAASEASFAPPVSLCHQAFLSNSRKRLTAENDFSPKQGLTQAALPRPNWHQTAQTPEGCRLEEKGDHLWHKQHREDRLAEGSSRALPIGLSGHGEAGAASSLFDCAPTNGREGRRPRANGNHRRRGQRHPRGGRGHLAELLPLRLRRLPPEVPRRGWNPALGRQRHRRRRRVRWRLVPFLPEGALCAEVDQQPRSPQVPHEAHRQARFRRVRAHQLGRGARHHRREVPLHP